MTTRELLHTEIDALDETSVEAVYRMVKTLATSHKTSEEKGLLQKLQEIKIDGPPDFSINLDHYLYGVERVQEDIR